MTSFLSKPGGESLCPGFRINFKLKVKVEAEIKVKIKAKTNDQIKLSFTIFNSRFKLNAILQSLNAICG